MPQTKQKPGRSRTPAEKRKAKLARRYRRDPVFFIEDVLGATLWSKQREIAESVRDNRRTAVKACHGPGKTFTAAAIVLWFLRLRDSRVVTTAPTWTQIKTLLWHEIHQLAGRSKFPYDGQLNQTELKLPDGRYAVGLSTRKEEAEKFQGHHAENILLVFDEASGVPASIFEAGEGYMTTPGARMLLIGNPTRPDGEFHAAFHSKRAEYSRITISAYDLPAVTGEKVPAKVLRNLTSKEWIEEKERTWKGTPLFDVKVLGEFPRQAENAVVALGDVEDAQARELPIDPKKPKLVACDVARFGDDETVIATREDNTVRIAKAYVGQDTMQTVGHIKRIADQLKTKRVVVDDTGVGGGVTDRLRELGYQVTAFNGGEQAVVPEDYPNARSELWFNAAQQLPELDLEPDDQLAADLSAPMYRLDSRARRVVEPKDQTKKRIGRSPDRGDAVLLTCAPQRRSTVEIW